MLFLIVELKVRVSGDFCSKKKILQAAKLLLKLVTLRKMEANWRESRRDQQE